MESAPCSCTIRTNSFHGQTSWTRHRYQCYWSGKHNLCLNSTSSCFHTVWFSLKHLEIWIVISWIILKQDGLTALHTAIIGRKDVVTSHLLRKGASPHVKDRVSLKLFIINFSFHFFSCFKCFKDFITVTGWCYTSSLCYSSWCHAHCEVIT